VCMDNPSILYTSYTEFSPLAQVGNNQKKLRLRFLWYIYLLLTRELLTIGLNLIVESYYQESLHWSVCALLFLRKVKTHI